MEKELGTRFGVSGYPTLKFFKKGGTADEVYNGGRTAEDIVKYVQDLQNKLALISYIELICAADTTVCS